MWPRLPPVPGSAARVCPSDGLFRPAKLLVRIRGIYSCWGPREHDKKSNRLNKLRLSESTNDWHAACFEHQAYMTRGYARKEDSDALLYYCAPRIQCFQTLTERY